MYDSPRVAVVSFTDPRATDLSAEREAYNRRMHEGLVSYLAQNGIECVDLMGELLAAGTETFGLSRLAEVLQCAPLARAKDVEALIVGCWVWTDSILPVRLVRETDLPVALYSAYDPERPDGGVCCTAAVGASLWEQSPNDHARKHARFRGEREELLSWIRGTTAAVKLRRSTHLLWGGTYSLRMEHLQDDIPRLKAGIIGDILFEDQYMLIKRAESILAGESARVESFHRWFSAHGGRIVFDATMLTESVWRKQIALYLAARDRLAELKDERITGVSVKCQPELSEEFGVTPCTIPAFLNYCGDAEGEREVVATVCEGDIKGLLACDLMSKIAGGTPTLFGDFKEIGPRHLIVSNCGAASVFYAGNSCVPGDCLKRVTVAAQCQGKAGGAIGFHTPATAMTAARMTRIGGRYFLQLGLSQVVPQHEASSPWGGSWPQTALDFGVDPGLILTAIGGNHFSAVLGDVTAALAHAAIEAGLEVVRLDREEALRHWLERIRFG